MTFSRQKTNDYCVVLLYLLNYFWFFSISFHFISLFIPHLGLERGRMKKTYYNTCSFLKTKELLRDMKCQFTANNIHTPIYPHHNMFLCQLSNYPPQQVESMCCLTVNNDSQCVIFTLITIKKCNDRFLNLSLCFSQDLKRWWWWSRARETPTTPVKVLRGEQRFCSRRRSSDRYCNTWLSGKSRAAQRGLGLNLDPGLLHVNEPPVYLEDVALLRAQSSHISSMCLNWCITVVLHRHQ